jgi:hypothetical protein
MPDSAMFFYVHDLESGGGRHRVSVYHSNLHLCNGVNKLFLVILLSTL